MYVCVRVSLYCVLAFNSYRVFTLRVFMTEQNFLFCSVTFPYGVVGHLWYLIVSIPDLGPLHFDNPENERIAGYACL